MVAEDAGDPWAEFLESIEGGRVPARYPGPEDWDEISLSAMQVVRCRDIALRYGMYAIVTEEWIGDLASRLKERSCLEIMGGGGWLSLGLSNHGVDVICTDDHRSRDKMGWKPAVYPVKRLDAVAAVKRYADREVLLVSWPPHKDHAVVRACSLWAGKKIVYIGEGRGGCAAPDEFFDHFQVHEEFHIPQWLGIDDRGMIGRWTD